MYTGKSSDGISIQTLAKLWTNGGNSSMNNRKLCVLLRRQEKKIAHLGEYVLEDGKKHRGIRGWKCEGKVVPKNFYGFTPGDDDISAAKIFEDPRLVYSGKSCDGISVDIINRLWAEGGNRCVSNHKICKTLHPSNIPSDL